ncbi:MCP methyltransferase, CheR-type [Magnetococcus marinus MC-1]|uniref:MCP methyltransferase, CheR-type n=1 Tax=Magnetococcus marinus (strain ATCC BAA-1437 / JCM 17883 / MC-1) TaxID=156889 RepID=A0L7P7_MAGMM|nr:protein-glutamate O-methyltransferase CheR [Magnetococcus marinus]ABK43990.1 MCP methyltransferase, CheR-type [Magnetococcus marinus MC-1]
MDHAVLHPLMALIKQRTGLQLDNDSLLFKLVQQGCLAHRCTVPAFLLRLEQDREIFYELINRLTINETYFYRESEHLQLLIEHLLPPLLNQQRSEPIRILSVGCSSGEEPYSIAMALTERFGPDQAHLFRLQGCDIDTTVLQRARQGQYGSFSFRLLDPQLKARYFEPLPEQQFQIKPVIAQQVNFSLLNLMDANYPSMLHGQDIIFFRNVSIYFDQQHRREIQSKLRDLLNFGGALVAGSAETLPNDFGLLTLEQWGGCFFFRKGKSQAAEEAVELWHGLSLSSPSHSWRPQDEALSWRGLTEIAEEDEPLPPLFSLDDELLLREETLLPEGNGEPERIAVPSMDQLVALLKEKRYGEALAGVELACAQGGGQIQAELLRLKGAVLLNQRQFVQAELALKGALQQDEWSLDALLLLGQTARWQGQTKQAIAWFQKAVYLDPSHWLAHYFLAELYAIEQQSSLAQREYRLVLRQLDERRPVEGTLLALLALAVPPKQISFLCQQKLAKLAVHS